MDEQCNCWSFLLDGSGLRATYGDKIINRALEMAGPCPPETNLWPYILKALAERAPDSASE